MQHNDKNNNQKNQRSLKIFKKKSAAASDDIYKIIDELNKRFDFMVMCNKILEERITFLEKNIANLEKEFYMDDMYEQNEEVMVHCPYCDEIIYVPFDPNIKETQCPVCGKPIEMDWNK